jgi:hypothetical protein
MPRVQSKAAPDACVQASVRKQHNTGFKHKSNVRNYYQQFLDVHMAQFAPAGLPYPGGPPGFPPQARMPLDGTAGLRPLGGPPPGMPFPMGGAPPGYPQPAAFRAPPPFAAAGPPPGYGPPPGWQPPGLPPGMLPPRP